MSEMAEQKPEPPQPQDLVITPKKPKNVITGAITRRLQIVSRSNKTA